MYLLLVGLCSIKALMEMKKKLIENGSGRLFLAAASAYVMSHPEMERTFLKTNCT
jgi:hypothetical protein